MNASGNGFRVTNNGPLKIIESWINPDMHTWSYFVASMSVSSIIMMLMGDTPGVISAGILLALQLLYMFKPSTAHVVLFGLAVLSILWQLNSGLTLGFMLRFVAGGLLDWVYALDD